MYKIKRIGTAIGLLGAFILWTLAVRFVNVASIGPIGSSVGLAAINGWFHSLTGVHMILYSITDWLGLVPVAVGFCFAGIGLAQWIKRKRLFAVDADILLLGGFYIVTIAVYYLFESVVVNYRPVLINGYLEASYPSSTTLLVLCVMSTTLMQVRRRIHYVHLRKWITVAILVFTAFMMFGRLISGVHWFSDIVGGVLLSSGLVMLYKSVCRK